MGVYAWELHGIIFDEQWTDYFHFNQKAHQSRQLLHQPYYSNLI